MSSFSRRAGDWPPPYMSRRRIGAVAAVLVSGLLLAGCSGGDGTAQSASTPTVKTLAPTAAPTPSPTHGVTTPPTRPLRVTGKMTRPGTRLRFGQKAIVPIREYNALLKTYDEGVLGIVVQRIRQTRATKIRGNFDANSRAVLKRSIAYYTKIVITNESGNAMSMSLLEIDGRRSGGGANNVALHGGELPGCSESPSPDSFDHKGARWVTCELWVSTPSYAVREVHYLAPPYGKNAQHPSDRAPSFDQHYDLGAIIWR